MLESLTEIETRPSATAICGGLLVSLRGINFSQTGSPEDMVSVRAFVWPNGAISARHRKVFSVQDIASDIESGNGPSSAYDWLTTLISLLTDNMSGTLNRLDEEVSELEELSTDVNNSELRVQISSLRRKIISIKRYLAPQREALNYLLNNRLSPLSEEQKLSVRVSYEHTARYLEELDALKERAVVVQEELSNLAAEVMNNRMYVLSIVAAIFLPLGFFTGLLGVNVGGIPGVEHPFAFAIVCIVMVLVVAVQVWLFRKNHWF